MRRRGMRASGDRLWRIVVGRRGGLRRDVRPRVPLVFVRLRPPEGASRPRRTTPRADCRVALHLQMSWPVRLIETHVHQRPHERTILRLPAPAAAPGAAIVPYPRPAIATGGVLRRTDPTAASRRAARASVAGHPAAYRMSSHHRTRTHVEDSSTVERVQGRTAGGRLVAETRPVHVASRRHLGSNSFPALPSSIVPPMARIEAASRIRTTPVYGATTFGSHAARHTVGGAADTVTYRLPARTAHRQPASRTLLQPSTDRTSTPATFRQDGPPLPPVRPAGAPPPIDVGRLSEEVYRHIQRRVRIERERRRG